MWTQFWDMHSGGDLKEQWNLIYIEAPVEEAKVIFYNRFGHNPQRVSCTCCGPDYSSSEDDDLAQLTGFHRNCAWDEGGYIEQSDDSARFMSLDQYIASGKALFIFAADIKPEERLGEVPQQGWVWA